MFYYMYMYVHVAEHSTYSIAATHVASGNFFFSTLYQISTPPPPTHTHSGVTPPKTGLQWQQPFLELVLACMNAQSTTHEELLGPLRTQLQSFLTAFDKVSFSITVRSVSVSMSLLISFNVTVDHFQQGQFQICNVCNVGLCENPSNYQLLK